MAGHQSRRGRLPGYRGFRGREEPRLPPPSRALPGEADVLWRFDMMHQLGSVQHNMASCSVTAAGDLLLVGTSNGVDESHENIPAPDAPSFIALDKQTGKLVWADNSPGHNILHGQWSSPAFAVLGGVPQAIFPGGDGWVYSFLAAAGAERQAQTAVEVRLQPQEVGLGGRRPRRPQRDHRHARDLPGPGVHRHGPRSRVRRRPGPPVVHRPDASAAT